MYKCITALSAIAFAPFVAAQQTATSAKITQLAGVMTPTDDTLKKAAYLDTSLPIEKRVEDLLSRLTVSEKASLLHGSGGFSEYGEIPRVGLPRVVMTDGPQGVRTAVPTTALPVGVALAATWNTDLAGEYGALLARDAKATGHRILLGPGVNLARTPLGGRNFEYYGEDPLLSGKIAAGYIRGVQSEKIAACIKHLAMNDQEADRLGVSSESDERTLREIHLRPFEIAVREAQPWSCMPAYNRIRGEFCAQNAYLNITLMRETLGFDGAFISDWGAWHDDKLALNGGCTIRMPHGKNEKYDAALAELVKSGKVSEKIFNEAVRRNLRMLLRAGALDPTGPTPRRHAAGNTEFARRAAAEAAVLLKNNGTLPLDPKAVKRVLVVGPNAAKRFVMSKGNGEHTTFGGSGATFGTQEITVLDAMRERFGAGAHSYPWAIAGGKIDREGLADAARAADAVIFVGGLDFTVEHEGHCGRPDKPEFKLSGPQAEVVKLLAEANPKTIAVMNGGTAMDLTGVSEAAPALALAWYPGEQGGRAIADLLFGDTNFSGKLPITIGGQLTDWRVHRGGRSSYPGVLLEKDGKPAKKQPDMFKSDHTKGDIRVYYKEGPALGYRGFELDGIKPLFAFGHGLSYTTFNYTGAALAGTREAPAVSLTLTNSGKREGAEVVQLYAVPPKSAASLPEAERPLRGLIAFAKVKLAPGESRRVTLPFRAADLANWDEKSAAWKTHPGEWTLEVAAASDDVRGNIGFTPADR